MAPDGTPQGLAADAPEAAPFQDPPPGRQSPDDSPAAATRRPARPTRRGLLAALLVGLIVLGAGLAVIASLSTRYAATSTLSFSPRQTTVSADIVQLATKKYAVVAGSTSTVDSAAAASSASSHDLRDALAVAVQPLTANLTITVTLKDRNESAMAVNSIADIVAKAAADDGVVSGAVTDRADPAAAKRQPNRTLLLVIAIAAAVLVGGWVGFWVRHLTRRSLARNR